MGKRAGLLFVLTLGLGVSEGYAGPESIVGKWLMKAETPQGPLDLQLDLKQDAGQLLGTVTVFDSTVAVTGLKFADPQVEMLLPIFEGNYKISGVLKGNRISGTWEQVGGDMKGTWTAEKSAAVPPQSAAASDIVGKWLMKAETPQGPMELQLNLTRDGGKLAGTATVLDSTVTVTGVQFENSSLVMQLPVFDGNYKVAGVLKDNSLSGTWEEIGGDMKGTWTGERSAAVAAAQAGSPVDGTWVAVASTPDGDIDFGLDLKQAGEAVEGKAFAGSVSIPVAKGRIAANKLTFEAEYQGGIYRFEAVVAGEKLTGKWSSTSGAEAGTFSAHRPPK